MGVLKFLVTATYVHSNASSGVKVDNGAYVDVALLLKITHKITP
jgi:hypothetical protein